MGAQFGDRRDTDHASIDRELREVWPELDWSHAKSLRGAFHRIILFRNSTVIRATTGTAHESRAQAEMRNLAALASRRLPLRMPDLQSTLITLNAVSAYRTTFVSGKILPHPPWEAVREPIAAVLATLISATRSLESLPIGLELRPTRDWCGGEEWLELVRRIMANLADEFRRRAAVVVAQVLEIERSVSHVLVHGDFGPHNLLFSDDGNVGVIDFDNACLGDPAIDIAPLIGFFGSDAVADVADTETIVRGRVHRASLPLQIAAAADRAGDEQLRNHALHNFVKRVESGTLYEPNLNRS